MARTGARAALGASALLLALAPLASCARKGAPSGGPPDIEPPRLIAAAPDSGAHGVAHDVAPSLTFSEGMDPRSTAEAIAIAPRVDIVQRRWSGRRVTIVLAETLKADQTYTLFLGRGARDRHGNPLEGGATVVFTTADTMPPGILSGRILARGFPVDGTYLWCYDAATGRAPDSTARDFDAVGLADGGGGFRVVGLPVPGRYRLWVFADLNHNRSFEPASDILTPLDTVFALSAEAPAAESIAATVSNPHSPGKVRGAVLDSLADHTGTLGVVAVAADDSSRRVLATVDDRGRYELQVRAGVWLLRAWRDVDRSRDWQPAREPASPERRVEVGPAAEIVDVDLVLERAPGGR